MTDNSISIIISISSSSNAVTGHVQTYLADKSEVAVVVMSTSSAAASDTAVLMKVTFIKHLYTVYLMYLLRRLVGK